MNWTGKRVLVTGAGGFIGSHLTERLVELGASVRALVHYNSLGSWGWLDTSPLIAIPYSYVAPISYVNTNIIGTLNVLENARQMGTERVLHTSTSEVYGTALEVPISEKHPLQGQSPYSASKIGADKLAESYFRSFETPVVTVRPFNTFGPRQSARAVMPTIISQALSQDRIKLGSLTPTRDLNFVSNTVDGFIKAAEAPKEKALGATVNLGSNREISVSDLAKAIIAIVGRPVEIVTDDQRLRPAKSEVERLLADNRLAKELIGWEPKIRFEDGLRTTIEWMMSNLGRYRADVYNV